jgi:RNA polymerase-binding transcription factor DksA
MNENLTDSQVRQLRQLLDDRFNTLWKEIGAELDESDQERFLQVAGEAQDLEDRSFADLISDLNITLIDKHVQETRDINDALIRINKGTIGHCGECGGYIDFERLLAYPTASRCLRCQQVYEKTHAGGDHSTL